MKILLCHNFYRAYGGEDRAVESLADLLVERGHTIRWLRETSQSLSTYTLRQKLELVFKTVFSTETFERATDLVADFQPDVAHIHNVFPLLSPSLYRALANAKVPIVQTLHNFRWLCPNGLFYVNGQVCRRCEQGNTLHAVLRLCLHGDPAQSAAYAAAIGIARAAGYFPVGQARVIALNRFTANIITRQYGAEIQPVVLGNFLDVNDFTPRTSIEGGFIFMGRLSAEKGLLELLAAMRRLPGVPLTIVGTGPLETVLQIRAQEWKLSQVTFAGFLAGVARFELLKQARALIIPSQWHEQFPMVILEAFALGVPVVATRNGGLPEIIVDGECGFLYDAGDIDELAERLRQLNDDDQIVYALGQAARRRVEQHYSAEVFYPKLMQVYEEARWLSSAERNH